MSVLIGQGLRRRLLLWRLRRTLVGPLGPVLLAAVAALVVLTWSIGSIGFGPREYRSTCLPYVLRLPASWQLEHVHAPDCGNPVLSDQFRLGADGERYTLTVEAASLSSGRLIGEADLSRFANVRRSRSGQAYALFEQPGETTLQVNAGFIRGGLSYLVTAEGAQRGAVEVVLARVMDGWYARGAPR